MRILRFVLFFLFPFFNANAQLFLSHIPADGDSICDYPISPDPFIDTVMAANFDNAGFKIGDTVPDFKLYDLYGDSMEMQTAFDKGKPILLIAGNYTCPVFRQRIPDINTIAAAYSGTIAMGIVYVIEAHPDTDVSPYSGSVWTSSENYSENILYRQPRTYGERKAILTDMITNYTAIDAPIMIDGPCNEWWLTFGPAPNIAYLITKDGVVFTKQGWFNKAPYNMSADIDSLLGYSGIAMPYNKITSNLSVFSDAAQNSVSFNLEGNDCMQSLEIFDVLGNLILKKDLNNIKITSVDLSKFKNGLCLYKIYTKHRQVLSGNFEKLN